MFEDLNVPENSIIQFKTLDGFSSHIPKKRLLNTSNTGSVAYVAIEEPGKKWPSIKGGELSPAPFYLVWLNPEKSNIRQEEYPFMLSGFKVEDSLKSLYPNIYPKVQQESPTHKGFNVFVQHCFACHTLNKEGASKFGPDLNYPYSSVEYYRKGYLLKLIRDPQNLRHWPDARMYGFPKEVISDKDIDNLLRYFDHMAKNRK